MVSVYGDEPSPFHCGQKNNRQPETQNPFQAAFVYDIAIAINDWARTADNHIDPTLQHAFLNGYQSIRRLTPAEQDYLPTAYRTGCIRFWVSRLLDYHFPAEGEMTFIKDPNVFRNLLLAYRNT